MLTTSCDCRVVADRSITEAGSIVYGWAGDGRRFPEDVSVLYIRMPVTWDQVYAKTGEAADTDPEYGPVPVDVGWHTRHPLNSQRHATWELSGTVEAPTLLPSLHWIGVWHGFLQAGRLVSC
jgi:Family of unknown function (DUF6527)